MRHIIPYAGGVDRVVGTSEPHLADRPGTAASWARYLELVGRRVPNFDLTTERGPQRLCASLRAARFLVDLEHAADAAVACGLVPQGSDPASAPGAALNAALALAHAPASNGVAAGEALAEAHRRLAGIIRSLHPSADAFFAEEKPGKGRAV